MYPAALRGMAQTVIKLITRVARAPVLASQEPPGNVERSRIQMGQDVCGGNVHVSTHVMILCDKAY